ncbi:zinc transporter 1 precursor [Prunus dulcis]|uniref:Zinc transporter 1 n=1 Tax=Prunus dulcis TaxID=3755 RepID=A0A5H2XVI4_PRUDU|nr:zinc transporter 1 precursor [Prunus dulcis]
MVVIPMLVFADCSGEAEATEAGQGHKPQALKLKVAAIASVLFAGAMGVGIPILGKDIPCLNPGRSLFSIIKAFAAGVILATGFIHVLPDAFDNLTSPCLTEHPWGKFPFTGFVAMVAVIGTLMVDAFATSYYSRSHQPAESGSDVEQHQLQVLVHGHSHVHGSAVDTSTAGAAELLRNRVISQVLELGILVHSVMIGLSLGVSASPDTIRPLVAALAFHQLFEGMGLGGCIAQASFKSRATAVMALFFSLTTPIGIAIGIGISNIYTENSPIALAVEGILNAASAGILIYTSLGDMLVADFMSSKLQSNLRLLAGASLSVLLGAGCMSLLAIWA